MSRFAPGRRKFTVEKRLDSTEKELEDAAGGFISTNDSMKLRRGSVYMYLVHFLFLFPPSVFLKEVSPTGAVLDINTILLVAGSN